MVCPACSALCSDCSNEGKELKVQGDQLNMAVCVWYLVKSDLSSVHVTEAYTERVTYKVPEKLKK